MAQDYLRDPAAIYRESFRAIRAETDLSRLNAGEAEIAIRLVHACGMPDIVGDLVFSPHAVDVGRKALAAGAPIICDAFMVRDGIIARKLAAANPILCELRSDCASRFASEHATTRSAGGIECAREHLSGALVAIGNAPTALFHLLQRLEEGWPRPALILGFPVGFVGAAESKQALIDSKLGIPFVTLTGRRGGSAMAAAAINALAFGVSD